MSIAEIVPFFQAGGSLAIAGGLLFTAVQFRHHQRALRVANFTKMVELQMHLREMRVRDPDLADVYRDDVRDLSSDRDIREYFFNLMQVSVYEIVWYSYREGVLPADYYHSWERRMRVIAAEPSFRKMVRGRSMKIMHDDFQRYITQLVEATPERSAA
ncbi:MAG: DUF6082 family protein [Phycisphaerales bacterium]